MDTTFQSQYLPYSQTGKFSKIVLDYISQAPDLRNFYEHPVNIEGIKSAIQQRKIFKTNRKVLVAQFENQYKDLDGYDAVKDNIHGLIEENTFTICTAHQPNIFTGHLYFVYKIIHIIKIADSLKSLLPEYNFVPVFFMGSEDADLEELNHVVIDGEKYEWITKQKGAVGRMKVDDNLLELIDSISGRLSVEEYGKSIIGLITTCFKKGSTIEHATFLFVHQLFKEFGLLVLLPDSAAYKKEMLSIIEEDIFDHTSSKIVNETSEKLAVHYKAQAYPREINLFYLKDDVRNRIVAVEDHFLVHDTDIVFTKEEIKAELKSNPERFSPNVILRGLFQEIILPDIAWIGGGGELAYWLQLKDLFKYYEVPYPVLVVRNSFVVIEEKYQLLLKKLDVNAVDLFKGETNLLQEMVNKNTTAQLSLESETIQFKELYERVKKLVKEIDTTLVQHTAALETKHLKALYALEKKMFRAEKRKFSAQQNQLIKIFSALFPHNGLQERTENFMLFYSKYGKDFLQMLYEYSLTLEQQFCVITGVKSKFD